MAIWMDRKFRDAIHDRDRWKCRICERPVGRGTTDALPVLGKVKFIKGEGLYGKSKTFDINHQPDNLMTLCIPCQKLNTARLTAERVHGVRRMIMDGRTYERIMKEAIRRGVDLETCLVQILDALEIPGKSGLSGLEYGVHGLKGQHGEWRLDQRPRPAEDRGPVEPAGEPTGLEATESTESPEV